MKIALSIIFPIYLSFLPLSYTYIVLHSALHVSNFQSVPLVTSAPPLTVSVTRRTPPTLVTTPGWAPTTPSQAWPPARRAVQPTRPVSSGPGARGHPLAPATSRLSGRTSLQTLRATSQAPKIAAFPLKVTAVEILLPAACLANLELGILTSNILINWWRIIFSQNCLILSI